MIISNMGYVVKFFFLLLKNLDEDEKPYLLGTNLLFYYYSNLRDFIDKTHRERT